MERLIDANKLVCDVLEKNRGSSCIYCDADGLCTRGTAEESLLFCSKPCDYETPYGIDWFVKAVKEQPTVAAAPVVYGRWVGEGDGYWDGDIVYDVWHCSECGYTIDDGTDNPDTLPHYCPNCGAKMDKED